MREGAGGTAGPGSASGPAGRGAGSPGRRFGGELPWLLALLAASVLVRIVYLLHIRGNPTFLHPTADPLRYHERALEILAGDWFGRGIYFHSSPAYPYFLALNYFVNGRSLFATYVAQALIDAAGVLLLYALARRLGGPLVGRLAAVFALAYQAFIFFTGELLEITLVLACLTGAALLLVAAADAHRGSPDAALKPSGRPPGRMPAVPEGAARKRPPGASAASILRGAGARMFGAGVLLGLCVLGKPNILIAIPFLLVGWNLQAGRSWRACGRPCAACLLGIALAVLPVTLRNAVVAHDFVLTTSNGGINFYIGNNPGADGTFRVSANMQDDLGTSSVEVAEQAVGRALRSSEVSAYWFRQGLGFILRDPGRALWLLGRKLLLFLNAFEIPNYFDLDFFQRYSWLLRVTPLRFGTVLPLACAGLVAAWPRRRRLALAYLLPAGYAASVLPFFITARYRLPALPLLVFFAAWGVVALLCACIPALRPRLAARGAPPLEVPRWALIAALLLGAGVAHLPLCKAEAFHAHQYGAIASVYKQAGNLEKAVENYREAVALAPRGVLFRNSLAVCLFELGEMNAGEEMLRSALAVDPSYAPAWRNLGRFLESRGDTLGALEAQRRAFAANPHFSEAGVDLARILFNRGAYPEAEGVLRQVLARAPRNEYALWNLAVLLGTRMGRPAEAAALVAQLLRLRPDHREALRLKAYLDSERQAGAGSPAPAQPGRP